jgi:hypothetical protein
MPAEAGIQGFEFFDVNNLLDARLRGHDELRDSLAGGRGILFSQHLVFSPCGRRRGEGEFSIFSPFPFLRGQGDEVKRAG